MSGDDSLEDVREQKREQLLHEEDDDKSPSEPLHVDGESELTDTVEGADVVLVDFYADWCGPCKMLEPIVTDLAAETEATIAKVDVDANQRLAKEYGVQGVPTMLLFVGGEPVERIVGVQQKESLAETIAQHT